MGLNRSRGRVPVARFPQLIYIRSEWKRPEIALFAFPELNSLLKTEVPS